MSGIGYTRLETPEWPLRRAAEHSLTWDPHCGTLVGDVGPLQAHPRTNAAPRRDNTVMPATAGSPADLCKALCVDSKLWIRGLRSDANRRTGDVHAQERREQQQYGDSGQTKAKRALPSPRRPSPSLLRVFFTTGQPLNAPF